ncbi:MAG: FAD-binding protein [Fimbriimonadales bacterium]|nr:FAD-binding protein [Fimbriimonadales bacterium]
MAKTLILIPLEADGTVGKAARDLLASALAADPGADVGVFGKGAKQAADVVPASASRVLVAGGDGLASPTAANDARACEALVRASGSQLVLAPQHSRTARCLPLVAVRTGGRIDTRVAGISLGAETKVRRWYYRQRMQAAFTREERPWFLLLESGALPAAEASAGFSGAVEEVSWEPCSRTQALGTEAAIAGEQTIRPDADLLLVAGAGWTKKQSDGQTHVPEAEELIRAFLRATGASLGSSKSLVDQKGEGAVISFLTHMNQVGQTGSSPRHPKGLATCCHGEEPHVVGWRFIGERRAINLDPNCGWAQGKADVLYVADAFAVLRRLNELLG